MQINIVVYFTCKSLTREGLGLGWGSKYDVKRVHMARNYGTALGVKRGPTLRASLSGTLLQTLPDLVTPLNGHSFISAQLSTDAVSALRTVRVLI